MKTVISLLLLITCIAASEDKKGVTEYLIAKWRELHTIFNQFYSRRCFRTCYPLKEDRYWNALGGNVALSLSESKYLEYLTDLYNKDPEEFTQIVHDNATVGTEDLDVDQNNKISAEEYYTELLCLGAGLNLTKNLFDRLQPVDNEIQNYRFIFFWVDYMTEDIQTEKFYETMKNVSLAFNDTDRI